VEKHKMWLVKPAGLGKAQDLWVKPAGLGKAQDVGG
jgi:hypothetical protein